MNLITLAILFAFSSTALGATTYSTEHAHLLSDAEIRGLGGTQVGNRLFLGDIVYDVRQLKTLGYRPNLWPGGIVYYEYEAGLSVENQAKFIDACDAWAASSPVSCEPRTSEENYVLVGTHDGHDPDRCQGETDTSKPPRKTSCATLGTVDGESTFFMYTDHWDIDFVVQHELGHTFGLIHEQTRPDRDSFVSINWHNLRDPEKDKHNFKILPGNMATDTDYDFASIMHYGNCLFAKESTKCNANDPATTPYQTLFAHECGIDAVGGSTITTLDHETLSQIYGGSASGLFVKHRNAACGTHRWSKAIMKSVCGPSCAAAGDVQYVKTLTDYESSCSFLTNRKCADYCSKNYKKECVDEWYDRDTHIKCPRSKLNERWTKCGCSVVEVSAECSKGSTQINLSHVNKLIREGDKRDKTMGHFVKHLLTWRDKQRIETKVFDGLAEMLMNNYNKANFTQSIEGLHCALRVQIGARSKLTPDYVLPYTLYKQLAADKGLRD